MSVELVIRDSDGVYTPNIIGSADDPVTLTANYSGNIATFKANEFVAIAFNVFYTPTVSGRNLYLLVEGSVDGQNFAAKAVFKDDVNSGSVVRVFNDEECKLAGATSGEQYDARYIVKTLDRYLRISVKEDGVNNFGTAFIHAQGETNRIV